MTPLSLLLVLVTQLALTSAMPLGRSLHSVTKYLQSRNYNPNLVRKSSVRGDVPLHHSPAPNVFKHFVTVSDRYVDDSFTPHYVRRQTSVTDGSTSNVAASSKAAIVGIVLAVVVVSLLLIGGLTLRWYRNRQTRRQMAVRTRSELPVAQPIDAKHISIDSATTL